MNIWEWLAGTGIGIVLGVLYFGGLWLTALKAVHSRHPALWMFGSRIVRTALVLVVIFVWMEDSLVRAASCLVGFTVARLWLVRRSMGTFAEVFSSD